MEKGCILPDNLLQELSREGNVVLYSLSRFCECSKKDLIEVLMRRNTTFEGNTYGYRKYEKQVGKKKRTIREPYHELKKIQQIIKERLSQIPVSLACTAGKSGDSVEKNTEMHRYNQYLITLDIKNAYPSITTHRVYKNLQGALIKPLKHRCPLLEKDEDKDLFIKTITHLCVSENELPQGASTSTQIQNIVMAGFDAKIEKKLPELTGSHMIYSRYADDIAISFPHFSTMEILQEKMEKYVSAVSHGSTGETGEKTIEEFSKDTFIVTDRFELKYLQKKIEEIKEKILQRNHFGPQNEHRESHIGKINEYKKHIKYSKWRIRDIADQIIDIIGSEGRKINMKKVDMRTPQSGTEREINGMTFNHEGKRGIDNKKRGQYMRLLNDVTTRSIEDIEKNKFYRYKFKMKPFNYTTCIHSILSTIEGISHYVASIYGKDNIPRDLLETCNNAKKRREDYKIEKEKKTYYPGDDISF